MVVVRTYVEYIPVAEFVTEVDKSESIKEALYILKSLNPDCWSGDIMLDYSDAKINAVKTEFESAKILLCAFHREQAWERWARSCIVYSFLLLINFLLKNCLPHYKLYHKISCLKKCKETKRKQKLYTK